MCKFLYWMHQISLATMVLLQSCNVLQKNENLKLSFLHGSCLNVLEWPVLVLEWFCVRISEWGITIWNFVIVWFSCDVILVLSSLKFATYLKHYDVMVPVIYIWRSSPLDFFMFVIIVCCVWVLYWISVLQFGVDQCLICMISDFLLFHWIDKQADYLPSYFVEIKRFWYFIHFVGNCPHKIDK